jgi:ABC-type multidrug transport system ATPase subunit
VKATRLTKRYAKTPVLEDINLEVFPGESLALWGENGAGKTTLLKAILGLLRFQGEIAVSGCDASRSGKQARAKIGYVPQEVVFYDMSVRNTMAFYARLKKVDPGRVPVLLEELGLFNHQHKSVLALSGGLKQRLALAVALLAEPPLLLLDEPTANLDAQGRKEYLDLLLRLRREGKTIIFASHRLEEVEILADRVVVLRAGKIEGEIQPGQLRSRLAPDVILTLWIPEDQRQKALTLLTTGGWQAHLNGRGTVVVHLRGDEKVRALAWLDEGEIVIKDFEVEGVGV